MVLRDFWLIIPSFFFFGKANLFGIKLCIRWGWTGLQLVMHQVVGFIVGSMVEI